MTVESLTEERLIWPKEIEADMFGSTSGLNSSVPEYHPRKSRREKKGERRKQYAYIPAFAIGNRHIHLRIQFSIEQSV